MQQQAASQQPPRAHQTSPRPVRSPQKPGTPLAWLDVIPYLMGHFATVKEAVRFLMSKEVQASKGAENAVQRCPAHS